MSCLITRGNCNSEEEKMIGITFAVFTFTGNVDPNPPSWLPPWIFLEYCTGILLSASFKNNRSNDNNKNNHSGNNYVANLFTFHKFLVQII